MYLMNSHHLYWLLVNVVAVAGDMSITQYATFENSALLTPSPIWHVGVLAKERGGNIWVIHGTNTVRWDEYRRRWGYLNMKISEWKDSVNGTTVEGAVGAGSPTYDLFLDNCNNTRDAAVKYFSGEKSTLLQVCIPNLHYCGHEFVALGWNEYDNDTLYFCQDGVKVDIIERCSNRCLATGNRICCESCEPNISYCGHKLLEIGLKEYHPNTVYRCAANGQLAQSIANCSARCLQLAAGGAVCACQPGRTYCAYELVTQMNWREFEEYNATYAHQLIHCRSEELGAFWGYNCSNCMATHGNRDAYCQLEAGVFCGRRLNEMGWTRYDTRTLYQCGEDAKNHSTASICRSITNCSEECVSESGDFCACQPGRTYCLNELVTQMNWWWIKKHNTHQTVKCEPDKRTIKLGSCCTKCISTNGEQDAHCRWTRGVFCGRKLTEMGWPGYESDTLYRCGEETRDVNVISTCLNGTCLANSCTCIPMRTYCGHQLSCMGGLVVGWWLEERRRRRWWSHDDDYFNVSKIFHRLDHMLWQCGKDGTTLALTSKCKTCTNQGGHARCACNDTMLYCGHELYPVSEVPYDNNTIYRCEKEGRASPIQSCKGACVRSIKGIPFCFRECKPGETYCGSKLLSLGFTDYMNNSIYTCSTEGLTLYGRVDSFCTKCTPGQTYCGHQINYKQNVRHIELENRFVCQQDGSFKEIAECRKCIYDGALLHIGALEHLGAPENTRIAATGAYCQCVPGRTYCGHQLYPNYNTWNYDLSLNHIYRCSDDNVFVEAIKECSTCVLVNEEPECWRLPTPWYWFFMAIALPLLFISLCLGLVRTIIKHRRLQKFVQQHTGSL